VFFWVIGATHAKANIILAAVVGFIMIVIFGMKDLRRVVGMLSGTNKTELKIGPDSLSAN
jgi:hypothetical protein